MSTFLISLAIIWGVSLIAVLLLIAKEPHGSHHQVDIRLLPPCDCDDCEDCEWDDQFNEIIRHNDMDD